MQLFTDNFILQQDHSARFGCCPHPSSGVHKTVATASGTGHIVAATFFHRGHIWSRWKKVAATIIWPVTEAVVTVLCTPDDRCGQHPKHVEWSCIKIKLSANSCISLVYYNIVTSRLSSVSWYWKSISLISFPNSWTIGYLIHINWHKLVIQRTDMNLIVMNKQE